MAKGDHLFGPLFGPTTHHAIDVGDGTIVHWSTGRPDGVKLPSPMRATGADRITSADFEVRRTPINLMATAGEIKVRAYDVDVDRDAVVGRALSRVGERGYSVVFRNCEHFATWCVTGNESSAQVRSVERRVLSATSKVLGRWSWRLATRQASRASSRFAARWAAKAGAQAATRACTPWLLVADVAQLAVEYQQLRSGVSTEKSTASARATGLAASLAIGAAVAGPMGAGVGGATWLGGELLGCVSPLKLGSTS